MPIIPHVYNSLIVRHYFRFGLFFLVCRCYVYMRHLFTFFSQPRVCAPCIFPSRIIFCLLNKIPLGVYLFSHFYLLCFEKKFFIYRYVHVFVIEES